MLFQGLKIWVVAVAAKIADPNLQREGNFFLGFIFVFTSIFTAVHFWTCLRSKRSSYSSKIGEIPQYKQP